MTINLIIKYVTFQIFSRQLVCFKMKVDFFLEMKAGAENETNTVVFDKR